ncbi:MAG: hypothetical protein AB1797_06870 [bacterium]
MLEAGCSMLDPRGWMLEAGCSMLDPRGWMLDAGKGSSIEDRGSSIEFKGVGRPDAACNNQEG